MSYEDWLHSLNRLKSIRAMRSSRSRPAVDEVSTYSSDAVPNTETMYEAYERLFREQEWLDMKGSSSFLRTNLTLLLQGCPRLVSIHFVMHEICDPAACRGLWHRNRAFKQAAIKPRYDPLPVGGGVHALTQVIRAAHDSRSTVHELVVTNIKVFRWNFACYDPYDIEREAIHRLKAGAVRTFLRHANSLKVLDLKLNSDIITSLVNVLDLMGDTTLPHLEQLLPAFTTVTASTLGAILLQYQETLQRLSLHSIHFSGHDS
ncbi:hypothetical protein Slin14017_G097050 [Septoria linicola]|nr:hypothetical protein Slin14017_G097050 [Septoria linicola]